MVEGKGGESLNKDLECQMVAWWKAKGGNISDNELDFRWSHGGRQWGGTV